MSDYTGFDAAGNYLPSTFLIDIIDEQKAEIARLRAALEDLATGVKHREVMVRIARKALAEQEGK